MKEKAEDNVLVTYDVQETETRRKEPLVQPRAICLVE